MTDYEKMTAPTQDQMAYIALAASIAALPDEIKGPIIECQRILAQTVTQYGDAGLMALALVGMKLQAEIET